MLGEALWCDDASVLLCKAKTGAGGRWIMRLCGAEITVVDGTADDGLGLDCWGVLRRSGG